MDETIVDKLADWGQYMQEHKEDLELAVLKSKRDNKWYEPESQWQRINLISEQFLKKSKLEKWLENYRVSAVKPQVVALICTDIIPAAAFRDILAILVSGHNAIVKLSQADAHLLPEMIAMLARIDETLAARVHFVDKLTDYDAILATEPDKGAAHFYRYFTHVPHLIRKRRYSIAVIDEHITQGELEALRCDLFDNFGLSERNISLFMLPQIFDKEKLYASLLPSQSLKDNDKYENNYSYNLAVCMMEHHDFKTNDEILFIESSTLPSRIATVHLCEYASRKDIDEFIEKNKDKIQCIVANATVNIDSETIQPGDSRFPELWDYPDKCDTLQFLLNL